MKETTLKKWIFYFLVFSKLAVIGWIWFHWDTGGFSTKEMFNVIAMIVPLFSVYASAMFGEYVKNRRVVREEQKEVHQVSATFRNIAYLFFFIYVVLIIYVIGLKPQGRLDITEVGTFIAAIESVFGVYLGRIVFGLFGDGKKE